MLHLKTVFDLTAQQQQNTNKLESGELQAYIEWLSKRNYEGGTVIEWQRLLSSKKVDFKKLDELTPEQKANTKGLINAEVRDYIIWLSSKNYKGGTVAEWQHHRLTVLTTKKEINIVVHGGGHEGPYVTRVRV